MAASTDLFRAALPPVGKQPLRHMPRRLYTYVWAVSRRQQVRLGLITILVFPLSLLPLELQRRIVDDAIMTGDVRLLLLLAAVYLGVLLLHGGLKFVRSLYQNSVSEGVIRLLRRRMSRHGALAGETAAGTKQAIIASEAEQLGGFVGESMAFPLLQGGIILLVAGYMLFVEPLIAVVSLGFFVPAAVLAPILQRIINRLAEQKTTALRDLGESVLENDRESGEGETRAAGLIDRIYRLRMRLFALKHAMKFLNNLFAQLGPLSVLLAGGWLAIQGETQVGTIVAFLSGYQRMTDPARELLNFYRRLSQMRVQYRLVREQT